MPLHKPPTNPFNGLSYFNSAHDGTGAATRPGTLYLGSVNDSGYNYYGLIYLGTESTSFTDWHANMGTDLAGLRNGIFMARLRP